MLVISTDIRHTALWFFIQFPSGCCFVLLRPDAVPFGLLRHSSTLLGVFLKPLGVLFELLGSLLGASWEPLGASCLPFPPPAASYRARPELASFLFFAPKASESSLNFTSLLFSFLVPSWLAFGLHFGSLLGSILA